MRAARRPWQRPSHSMASATPPVAERSSWRRRGRAGTACAPDAGAGGSPGRRQRRPTGIASGSAGNMYVLVFGNPGGPPPYVAPPSAGGSAAASGPSAPPSYVLGVDARGFIMHEIQPSDTLGDIALLYGYTWDDIPYMKDVNGLADHYSLQVGEVFLVPPHDGTYTPTPDDAQSAVGTPEAADEEQPTATPQPSPREACCHASGRREESAPG